MTMEFTDDNVFGMSAAHANDLVTLLIAFEDSEVALDGDADKDREYFQLVAADDFYETGLEYGFNFCSMGL